ncbi:MAG: methylamine utilization protein MauG [Deltaproteobacteria bacterium]|nr:methylamine utilization protein MauG [Deltaproteobacteria bacterium]
MIVLLFGHLLAGIFLLLVCTSTLRAADSAASPPLPLGLPPLPPPPADNPPTPEKVALGRRLFFDRRLSPNDTMSCAMCHLPTQGFTVNETRLAVGINGHTTRRNPPTLYNVAYQRLLFHDGREFALEDQVISPLTNPMEMGNPSIGYIVNKIRELPGYREQFQQAFAEDVSVATLGKALASYERTLLSGNSPFDRWYFGREKDAVSDQVKAGFKIFRGKGQCFTCHTIDKIGTLFSGQGFRNTGVAQLTLIPEKQVEVDLGGGLKTQMPRAQVDEILTPPGKDLGRYEVTLDPTDVWRYKTPSLRNIALTAPYMHNGVLLTLEDVIEYYDHGGTGADGQDPRVSPLHLKPEEKQALLALLRSFTGDNVALLAQEGAVAEEW